jgi:hypothetical protein
MSKLIFLYFLIGYSLACITVNVEVISDTQVKVVANNNTISICNSVLDSSNIITCGNSVNNITISDYDWKLYSAKHSTGWKAFTFAQTATGNVVKFGQYNCNKLG